MNKNPTRGSRFVMHDTEYEIQYVSAETVRYSNIIGGKTFSILEQQYTSLIAEGVIVVTYKSNLNIHEHNVKELARKMKYVTAILACSTGHLKQRWVMSAIKQTASEIQDQQPPAYDTTRRWVRTYRKGGQNALVPVSNGNTASRFDGETQIIIAEEIEKACTTGFEVIGIEVHAFVVSRLYSLAREQRNYTIKIPSVRTIQRKIKSIDYYRRLIAKHGKAAANRLIRASGAKVVVPYPMSVVQIDTHFLDLIVIDPVTFEPIGRPFLVLIICIHTKRIVGYFISLFPPSATTTLQAVKNMLVHVGCPAIIIPDRGVEFLNTALFHLSSQLMTTLELSQVRQPNHKADVESLFKTITLYLIQRMEGTTHSNPIARGDYDSVGNAIFTLDQVKHYFDLWINEVYDLKPHSQTGRAPRLMWENSIADMPLLRFEPDEIEILARKPQLATVHSGRVQANNLTYYAHSLTRLNGKKVTVLIDEMDLGRVYVKDPDSKTDIIQATSTEPNYTSGLTLNQHQLVREQIKKVSKAELDQFGAHAWQLGLARLMDEIRDDALTGKKRKKALNGQRASQTALLEHDTFQETSEGNSLQKDANGKSPPKPKNQPKTSNTKGTVYVDNSDEAFEQEDVDDYAVMEI